MQQNCPKFFADKLETKKGSEKAKVERGKNSRKIYFSCGKLFFFFGRRSFETLTVIGEEVCSRTEREENKFELCI